MWADINTKPLNGEPYRRLRTKIMNCPIDLEPENMPLTPLPQATSHRSVLEGLRVEPKEYHGPGQRGSAQARRPQYPREVAVAVALGRWNEIPYRRYSTIRANGEGAAG